MVCVWSVKMCVRVECKGVCVGVCVSGCGIPLHVCEMD